MKRIFIITDMNKTGPANSHAAGWDPDTGGDQTFGAVKLSEDGQEPATRTACNTVVDEEMKEGILTAMGNVPFIEVYASGDKLGQGEVYRRDGGEWVQIGTGDLASLALEDAGLQRITEEEV